MLVVASFFLYYLFITALYNEEFEKFPFIHDVNIKNIIEKDSIELF